MKNIAIVAYSRDTSYSCREQLASLLGTGVNIIDYNRDSGLPRVIMADFVLFTSRPACSLGRSHLADGVPYMVVRRSINYNEVGRLLELAPGTDVLLVNDMESSANETVAILQRLGIDHLNYHPYSPDHRVDFPTKIAVTPGEARFVPDYIEQVVDIRTRLIDITSLIEMLSRLGMLEYYADFLSANYVRDIIELSKKNYYYKNEASELKDEMRRLESVIRRRRQTERTLARYTFSDMHGTAPALVRAKDIARRFARSGSTILIQAESGTGKELLAQSIHSASARSAGPFVAVNFAAITESLLDSELFGYEGGAFTGAARQGAMGLFERADRGTIFLDEIGDAPLAFQIKLLRVLQEKEIRRVGSTIPIKIDVRIIAATNQDLKALIRAGKFREDLYYRLNVLPLRLPPLRERRGDIVELAARFIAEFSAGEVDGAAYLAGVAGRLTSYAWPGNVRELQNVCEYLVNVCGERAPEIGDLPLELQADDASEDVSAPPLREQIVSLLSAYRAAGRTCGRAALAAALAVPESRVRAALAELAATGTITITRGRGGIKLSE